MVETWYCIAWMVLGVYAVLDGRNFGAAAVRPIVASIADERRQVLDAIGPLWSWHEVWLLAAGGVLLLAFPTLLATGFAGYYLALFIVLWLLVLRGIALEVGAHIPHPLWQGFWNFVLVGSSALLALLLGVALGSLVRGVPLDARGEFTLPLFTNFGVRGQVGLLDWYTLSTGVLALVVLAAHGATYLMLKTSGPLRERSRTTARRLWLAAIALGLIVAAETRAVRPELWTAFGSRPLAWASLAVAAAGSFAILSGLRAGTDRRASLGSSALILGLVALHAAASFPEVLHSTLDPALSLTADAAASRRESLVIALAWWSVALALSVLWAFLAGRYARGRVGTEPPAASS
jgi:cytochrome d ubiquinol oxidase subunit II